MIGTGKGLYMVYDLLAYCVIGQVVQAATDAAATRDFHEALANKESTLSRHPADYNLIFLGVLSETGQIDTEDGVGQRIVAQGAAWKAANDEQQRRLKLEA